MDRRSAPSVCLRWLSATPATGDRCSAPSVCLRWLSATPATGGQVLRARRLLQMAFRNTRHPGDRRSAPGVCFRWLSGITATGGDTRSAPSVCLRWTSGITAIGGTPDLLQKQTYFESSSIRSMGRRAAAAISGSTVISGSPVSNAS